MNLAIDHISANLSRPNRLDAVARAAGLSPFHFHRVFQAVVGQTPAEFVKRLRLERALVKMAHGRPRSLARLATECGFASPSDFSRCFRQRFGSPPSRFDVDAWRQAHRAELERLVAEAAGGPCVRVPGRTACPNPDGFAVRIRDLPARTGAYICVRNPYKTDAVPKATARLVAWAERHGLAGGQWLGYQWENPEITALEHCQYYVAVEAPMQALDRLLPRGVRGEIGRFRFPPMVVAQMELRGGLDLALRALQWFYGAWLARSGYVPDDHPGFEAWIGRPYAHGLEHFEYYAQVPVRRR